MSGIRLSARAFVPAVSPPVAAYGGAASAGDPQIWRWEASNDPGEMTQLTDFSGFDQDQTHNPVVSPDGTKVLFETLSAATGFREIWVVDNVPGSTPTQLVADASNYVIHPAWGADSDTFVYVHCAGGALLDGTIFKDTVSAPGSPTALKTASGGYSPFRPQFNFDGSRIAYIWDGGAPAELRCMDDDGSNDTLLDDTIEGYLFNDPPQFGWANTQNLIAYSDAKSGDRHTYIIADDGTGKTQLDANGDAAGVATNVSAFPFPADDSFVVITGNLGSGYISVIRAELDGSDTTALGSDGPENRNWFRGAIVYRGRIWYITDTNVANVAKIGSMAIDGTDVQQNFDNTLGAGNIVEDFTGGDGWVYN